MRQITLIRERKHKGRKTARPISLRGANPVVLKAHSPKLRKHIPQIRMLIRKTQDRFGIKIHALAIMPDHIHLVIKVDRREQFANAMRYLAGMIALKVAKTKLWAKRIWSRPLKYGKDQQTAALYVWRNSVKAGIFTLADATYLVGGVLQV